MERIRLRGFLMKGSKEKEHRISNLKNMINNINDQENEGYDDIEEDSELIEYLNDDSEVYDELEIDDEYIYHPDNEDSYAVDLEENPIDENYIIKTPKVSEFEDNDDEIDGDITGEISENFDNVVNAQVGGRPLLGIVSTVLGAILIVLSIFILESRSDRLIDNVVSGETNFIFIIVFIFGLLLILYGVSKVFGIKNPFEHFTKSIDSIDGDEDKKEDNTPDTDEKPSQIETLKNDDVDKESYKIGEFSIGDLKKSLKKPTNSSKPKFKESLDEVPLAKEKPAKKEELTEEEIEEIEYEKAKLESESIDDIFAEIEDMDEIPSSSKEKKNK